MQALEERPSRRFVLDDQVAFARLSGDHNPIHVSPLVARRLLFGGAIVHGIHSVLWALDAAARAGSPRGALRRLKARFRAPVRVGEPVELRRRTPGPDRVRLELVARGRTAVSVEAVFGEPSSDAPPVDDGQPEVGVPRELAADRIAAAAGSVPLQLDRELAARLFPTLAEHLPAHQMAGLLGVTRLVGMECPGLNSILSEVTLDFGPREGRRAEVAYSVASFDPRFSRVQIEVASSRMEGTVISFVRPSLLPPTSCASLGSWDEDYAGARALVVGGSRGLGEITAKLLALAGAETVVTYHHGQEEARAVVADIEAAGGCARAVHLDVTASPGEIEACLRDLPRPSHLYYFASPFAFEGEAHSFSEELFRRYLSFYVTGFRNTIRALPRGASDPIHVYYPSSVAVNGLPASMKEYALAKAAGETMCRLVELESPEVKITVRRLPRLSTDQTQSLLPADAADPVPFLKQELSRAGHEEH